MAELQAERNSYKDTVFICDFTYYLQNIELVAEGIEIFV